MAWAGRHRPAKTRMAKPRRIRRARRMSTPQVFALVFFIGLLVGLAAVTWRLRDLRSENEILRRMELEARAQSALAVAQLNCAAPCVVATESDCSD